MTKTHRIITEEEYDTDGRLLHKTVTEETEEWTEDTKITTCPADCPGTLPSQLDFQWKNPCEYGPSDSAGNPLSTEYTTTTRSELH